MARSNGPFGPPTTRPPNRRHPGDDPFAAPQPPSNGQWPAPEYPDPAQVHGAHGNQGFHFPPPEPDPNYGYNQQAPQAPQWGAQPDPRAFDLGGYMPNGGPGYPAADAGQYQQAPYSSQFTAPGDGYGEADAGYGDEFLDDEEDEPRRGRKWMFIVAALVGAIGVGGALAYTYKSMTAPSGRVPLVKAGDPNVKVRPDNKNERRVLSRVGDDAGRQTPATGPQADEDRPGEDSGPRRVRTIPIVPGGNQPAEEAAAPSPLPGMPGIMLDNVQRPAPQAQPPARETPPSRVVIGRPPPQAPPAAEPEEPAAPAARAKPPVQVVAPAAAKPAPPPPARETPPAVAKARAAPPPAPAPTGAGYVAVLSSQKTRVDALKKFADLQQKHGDVLSGKTPDVQEADLSARGLGTMYRLVVGPPGSREAALGICNQLKTAGQDCWVKEY